MPEPVTTTLGAAAGIGGKKLIEKLVEDSYQFVKAGLGQQMRKWKAVNHADVVFRRVKQLRLVKTIWQMEREVDLTKFYYPAKVQIAEQRVAIHHFDNFAHDGSILIEGTVGQGKSTFLRYLGSQDIFVSRRIPVFIELRRMRQGQTLMSIALHEMAALGFDMGEDVFHYLAANGRVLLLLDAFDELKEELRADITAEFEGLLRKHEKLRAIVTSRPDSGIATSPLVRVFQLCSLEGREYEEIIRMMSHDRKSAEVIIQGIRKDSAKISRVLDTPLMVALLIVRYRIDQTLPENASSFYSALFTLLLQRHDKAKGGYIRPRKSSLSDSELADFFNAFSYITRKNNETAFSRKSATTYAKDSLKLSGKNGDPEKALRDVIDITCLLLADADECKFIHRNIQEYHAALFIKDQPDDAAAKFYEAMQTRWKNWKQELGFLETEDRYRFLKNFHVPQCRAMLQIEGAVPPDWKPNQMILSQVFGKDALNLGGGGSVTFFSTANFWPNDFAYRNERYEYAQLLLKIKHSDIPKPHNAQKSYTIEELLDIPSVREHTLNSCMLLLNYVMDSLRKSEGAITIFEERKRALEF